MPRPCARTRRTSSGAITQSTSSTWESMASTRSSSGTSTTQTGAAPERSSSSSAWASASEMNGSSMASSCAPPSGVANALLARSVRFISPVVGFTRSSPKALATAAEQALLGESTLLETWSRSMREAPNPSRIRATVDLPEAMPPARNTLYTGCLQLRFERVQGIPSSHAEGRASAKT